jgi:hypothetical protein
VSAEAVGRRKDQGPGGRGGGIFGMENDGCKVPNLQSVGVQMRRADAPARPHDLAEARVKGLKVALTLRRGESTHPLSTLSKTLRITPTIYKQRHSRPRRTESFAPRRCLPAYIIKLDRPTCGAST